MKNVRTIPIFSVFNFPFSIWILVPPARFERATYGLEGRCSIQLSYGSISKIKFRCYDVTDSKSTLYAARIRRGRPPFFPFLRLAAILAAVRAAPPFAPIEE